MQAAQSLVSPTHRIFFSLPQVLQERPRHLGLARIDAALKQHPNDRCVASGVGNGGCALDAAAKPRRRSQRRYVQQRSKTPPFRAHVVQTLLVRLANKAVPGALQSSPLARDGSFQPFHRDGMLTERRVRRGYFGEPPRSNGSDVRSTRLPFLVVLLAIVAAGTWYYYSQRTTSNGETMAVYYTKLDGTSLGDVSVSLRPRQPDESAAEHRHNAVLYAAVEAVAGPPNDIKAIRFPPGTRVRGVAVEGSTATVDLSKEVEQQAGGSFGENGEFKGLVYTVTGIHGISAVQVTVDGARLETLPGGHLELDQPLHRSDW